MIRPGPEVRRHRSPPFVVAGPLAYTFEWFPGCHVDCRLQWCLRFAMHGLCQRCNRCWQLLRQLRRQPRNLPLSVRFAALKRSARMTEVGRIPPIALQRSTSGHPRIAAFRPKRPTCPRHRHDLARPENGTRNAGERPKGAHPPKRSLKGRRGVSTSDAEPCVGSSICRMRISAIVDARFSLIVDGETAPSRVRRGGAQVPGSNVAQPSTISLKRPPTRVVPGPVLGLD